MVNGLSQLGSIFEQGLEKFGPSLQRGLQAGAIATADNPIAIFQLVQQQRQRALQQQQAQQVQELLSSPAFGQQPALSQIGQLMGLGPTGQSLAGSFTGRLPKAETALQAAQRQKLEAETKKTQQEVASGGKAAEKRISGLTAKAGTAPTTASVKAVKTAIQTAKQMNASIERIRKIVKEEGTEAFDITGTESQRLAGERSRLTVLQNRLAELGALAGADLSILEDIVPDPTAFFTTGTTFSTRLDDFQNTLNSDLGLVLDAQGFDIDPKTTFQKISGDIRKPKADANRKGKAGTRGKITFEGFE